MRGFTDKALILLSKQEGFEECGSIYKYDYKVAVKNIIDYLSCVGISHDCLITDGLATSMDMHNPRWLATGAPEDMFFMRNFCGVPDYPVINLDQGSVDVIRSKFEIKRGLSPEERFPIVSKRVKYIEKMLIGSYTLVVVFGDAFRVKSKVGDGRAILRVNEKKFYTSMELSGEPVPINDFLQVPYGNQCLSEWGKYSGNS